MRVHFLLIGFFFFFFNNIWGFGFNVPLTVEAVEQADECGCLVVLPISGKWGVAQ